MESTMRAVVVDQACDPSEHCCKIEQVTIPEPKFDEVMIKMRTNGVCHTDVHAIGGDWAGAKATFPLIPGHEGIGIINKKGEGVRTLELGDRVGISWLHFACGVCEFCTTGKENVCFRQDNNGFTTPGCMSDFTLAKAAFVHRIPETLSDEEAAPLLCAGLTAYAAIKQSGVRPGQFFAIVGAAGGIGHMACQYANAMGLRVIAIDVGESKKAFCESLGVEHAINSETQEKGHSAADVVQQLTTGGAHGVLCCATHPVAFQNAFHMTRRAGTLVCVGLCAGTIDVPIVDLVMRNISVKGSIVGTREDLREALDFAARGLVRCNFTTAPLEEVNDVLDKLKRSTIDGRVVLQM